MKIGTATDANTVANLILDAARRLGKGRPTRVVFGRWTVELRKSNGSRETAWEIMEGTAYRARRQFLDDAIMWISSVEPDLDISNFDIEMATTS